LPYDVAWSLPIPELLVLDKTAKKVNEERKREIKKAGG
jgi:hypothetical protein